jgi:cell division GTPase FtsZ
MKRRKFLKAAGGMVGIALAGPSAATIRFLQAQEHIVKYAIVGTGGAGGRIVSQMAEMNQDWWINSSVSVEYFAVDTDRRSLDYVNNNVRRILLPESHPEGLGSCIDPAFARQVAWRHSDHLIDIPNDRGLEQRPVVVVVAGLGGGAGTGLAQAIAWKCRQARATTVVFAAMPFPWMKYHAFPLSRELRRLERSAHVVVKVDQDESRPEMLRAEVFAETDAKIAKKIRTLLVSGG